MVEIYYSIVTIVTNWEMNSKIDIINDIKIFICDITVYTYSTNFYKRFHKSDNWDEHLSLWIDQPSDKRNGEKMAVMFYEYNLKWFAHATNTMKLI